MTTYFYWQPNTGSKVGEKNTTYKRNVQNKSLIVLLSTIQRIQSIGSMYYVMYMCIPSKPKVCRILVISRKTMFFETMTFFGFHFGEITFFDKTLHVWMFETFWLHVMINLIWKGKAGIYRVPRSRESHLARQRSALLCEKGGKRCPPPLPFRSECLSCFSASICRICVSGLQVLLLKISLDLCGHICHLQRVI